MPGGGTRRGFWVFANAPTTIGYSATDPTAVETELHSGWNLVAFPAPSPVAGSSLVTRSNGSVVPLGSVLLPQFTEIQPDRSYRPVDVSAGGSLTPGRAYWVFAASPVTLSYGASSAETSLEATLRLDGNADHPTISNDGQTIVFSRFLAGRVQLFRAVGGSLEQNLSPQAGEVHDLTSTPSGDTAFVGTSDVRRLPLAFWTGSTTRTVNGNTNLQYYQPSLSADGTKVAYTLSTSARQQNGSYQLGPNQVAASSTNADATDIVNVSALVISSGLDPNELNAPSSVTRHNSPQLSNSGNLLLFRQIHDSVVTHWLYNFSQGAFASVPHLGEGNAFLAGNGEHVAFYSAADRAGDANGKPDVFLRTLEGGGTELVSVSTAGVQGNGTSTLPASSGVVSADGRFVIFLSEATNLVGSPGAGLQQLYLRDTQLDTTTRVALPESAGGASLFASLSDNGKYIVVVGQSDGKTYVATNPAVP